MHNEMGLSGMGHGKGPHDGAGAYFKQVLRNGENQTNTRVLVDSYV